MACNFENVEKILTSLVSDETVGVEASYKLAKKDLKMMKQYKDIIIKVGKAQKIDPAVIAGIISRESSAGAILVRGWDTREIGFGLMQINKNHHTIKGDWNSEEHLEQGTKILKECIKEIQKRFPYWTKEKQFKGGLYAYNAGPEKVCSYNCMDIGTPGDDYANDVLTRAKCFKRKRYYIDEQ